MSETAKTEALLDFQRATARLRDAAKAAEAKQIAVSDVWGPREVLAHITLWAVQAAEHFIHRLPPLNYGAEAGWGPEVVSTFDRVFETLAGSNMSAADARQAGWEAMTRQGVKLPLDVVETGELHDRVDDAFNAAAVTLIRDAPFDDVLNKTERSHQNLYRYLSERPARCFSRGHPTYERLLLIIDHHDEHSRELEQLISLP